MALDVITGMGHIIAENMQRLGKGYVNYNRMVKWNNPDTVVQRNALLPVLFTLVNIYWSKCDEYTMSIDSTDTAVHVAGQYLTGNWSNIVFPYYDPQQDNIVTDMLASMYLAAMKEDFQSAYGYLRTAQMLMTFGDEVKNAYIETDVSKKERVIKLYDV